MDPTYDLPTLSAPLFQNYINPVQQITVIIWAPFHTFPSAAKILNPPLKWSLKCHIGRCRCSCFTLTITLSASVTDRPIFSCNWRLSDITVKLLTFESRAYSCWFWNVPRGSLVPSWTRALGGGRVKKEGGTWSASIHCLENQMTRLSLLCPSSGCASIFSVREIWLAARQTWRHVRGQTCFNACWEKNVNWSGCPVFRSRVVSRQSRHGDQSRSPQIWDLHLQHGALSGCAVVSQLDLRGVQLWVWGGGGEGGAHTHKRSLSTTLVAVDEIAFMICCAQP